MSNHAALVLLAGLLAAPAAAAKPQKKAEKAVRDMAKRYRKLRSRKDG